MEQRVRVHERVGIRHPNVTESDVLTAWHNRIKCQVRIGPWPPQYAAIGFDGTGRALQMVAVYNLLQDEVLIFHAMPASENMKRELGLT